MALSVGTQIQGLVITKLYWRIGEVVWAGGAMCYIRVDGYASQESYQAGLGALISHRFEFPIDSEERLSAFNAVRTLSYEALKDNPMFENASDA